MIRVHLHRDGALTVHEHPHFLLRLFGAQCRDYEVEYAGAVYVNADTGRMVSYAAHKAIERALTKRAVERRFEAAHRSALESAKGQVRR